MLKSHSGLPAQCSLGDGLKTGCRMVGPGGAAVAGRRGVGRVFVTFQVTPCFALAHTGKVQ